MRGDDEEVRSLARRLHAHFDVVPELELRQGARVRVALLVRVWGVHPKGARALPGCAKCRELLAGLSRIVEHALGDEVPWQLAIEPFRRALYESRVVPGADEVALAIRLSPPGPPGATSAGPAEERQLKELRAQLRALGIPER